jgi:hypothetical protein
MHTFRASALSAHLEHRKGMRMSTSTSLLIRLTAALTAAVLTLSALGACGSADPAAPTSAAIAAAVRATPMMVWTGRWTDDGQPVTVTLRTMGDGDVLGDLTVGGATARLLVSGRTRLVHGSRAFWTALAEPDPGRYADQWAQAWAQSWQQLAPATLAGAITQQVVTDPDGRASIAPTAAAGRATAGAPVRPRGVPASATPVELTTRDGQRLGSVWLTSSRPPRVLGYSGPQLPGTDVIIDPPTPFALTATPGSPTDAAHAYASMAAVAAGLPPTVPALPPGTGPNFTVDGLQLPAHCRSGNCPIGVLGHNTSSEFHVQATIQAILSGNQHPAGSCLARMPLAAPGATVRGSCSVTDPRITHIWGNPSGAGLRFVQWRADYETKPSLFAAAPNGRSLVATFTARAHAPSTLPPTK